MKLFTTATAVVLVLLSSLCPAYAAEGGAGTTIYQNQMELSGGATYTNTISQNSTYGIRRVILSRRRREILSLRLSWPATRSTAV